MSLDDDEIAREWPERWFRANTGRNQSKKRNNLRKWYRGFLELGTFREANPAARCANCAHYDRTPFDTRRHCDLDSDFHGYAMTQPDHVCTRWKELEV